MAGRAHEREDRLAFRKARAAGGDRTARRAARRPQGARVDDRVAGGEVTSARESGGLSLDEPPVGRLVNAL